MLRIGIDAHNLEGNRTGVGRYLENLLRAWAKDEELLGKMRFLLYFKGPVPPDTFLLSPIFVCKSLQVLPKPSFFFYFLLLLPLRAWLDKIDVMFFPGYMISPFWLGRSALVLHDVSFERFPELFALRYRIPYRLFGRLGARRSGAILTVSNFSAQEIHAIYGAPYEKIFVTPLGIDRRIRRASDADIARVKKMYGVAQQYIMYIGQIFARRHVREAMEAFARIAPEFRDIQFLVVGENRTTPFAPIDDNARKINQRLGREAIIRRRYAAEDDLPTLYSGARFTVYLSDYEGFGLPPLEALACGTPTLATSKTSLGEVLGGLQIAAENPSNPEEIAQKMRAMLNDPNLAERIHREGPAYAARFSWRTCAKQTKEILLRIARKSSPATT